MIRSLILSIFFIIAISAHAQVNVDIYGDVVDAVTEEPLIGANVVVEGTSTGTVTDIDGKFTLNLTPGTYNITFTYLGYRTYTRDNVIVQSKGNDELNIALDPSGKELQTIEVIAEPFARSLVSPNSIQKLSPEELKTYPGGNNDIAKVVQSLPGISGSLGGFRNDIIIRGGAPNENVYYLDGIEIPNINHFSTQGASGGPVGLLNVQFIDGVELSASSFHSKYDNPLSGVLQFDQRNGNRRKFQTNVRVSASEAALTLEGPLFKRGKEEANASYMFSLRRSYLQWLFQLIGLPIRPDYYDYQYKFSVDVNDRNSVIFTGIGAIDDFSLKAPDDFSPEQQATLDQVPIIEQYSSTTGMLWKRRRKDGKGLSNISISYNRLRNEFSRYANNEAKEVLLLRTFSRETEIKLRPQFTYFWEGWSIDYGLNVTRSIYTNNTANYTANYTSDQSYKSGLYFTKYGMYAHFIKSNIANIIDLSFGIRSDANNFIRQKNQLLNTISPRFGASVRLDNQDKFRWTISAGKYYKLPPYTVLGFQNQQSQYVNQSVNYIGCLHLVTGAQYTPTTYTKISLEGFYKQYSDYPFSVEKGISLANLGGDFSILGDEQVRSSGKGRAYGLEFLLQRKLYKGIYGILSYTYFFSEFTDEKGAFKTSAWDNRHLISFTGGYKFGKNYEISLRTRWSGRTPYAPIDLDRSLAQYPVIAYEYNRLGEVFLSSFNSTDIRFDKKWNFKRFAFNLYLDIQNVFAQAAPSPPSYGLDRDEAGEIIEPKALIKLPDNGGARLPSIGIVFDF